MIIQPPFVTRMRDDRKPRLEQKKVWNGDKIFNSELDFIEQITVSSTLNSLFASTL